MVENFTKNKNQNYEIIQASILTTIINCNDYFCVMKQKLLILFAGILALIACNNENENKSLHANSTTETATPFPEVILNLQEQIKNHRDSESLRMQVAQAFDSIGAYKNALAQMDTLLQKDSMNYGFWFAEGQFFQHNSDTIHAIESYSHAAKIYPSPDALLSIANLYAEQGNPRSLMICNRVIDLGLGKEYDAHCDFIAGVFYARTLHRDKALELFDECISNDFTYMEAYIEKGLIYFDEKKYPQALEVFRFASSVDNLFPDSYYWMARCYEMMGVKDSAVLRFKQSLSLDKTIKEAHDGLKRLGAE